MLSGGGLAAGSWRGVGRGEWLGHRRAPVTDFARGPVLEDSGTTAARREVEEMLNAVGETEPRLKAFLKGCRGEK